MDNSPLWDKALQNIDLKDGMVPPYNRSDDKIVNGTDRPTKWTYDRYVWLVELAKQHNYSESRIRQVKENNFLLVDVLFNSILIVANKNMAELAEALGRDGTSYLAWADEANLALNSYLWDNELKTYVNYDMLTNSKIPLENALVASSFAPLYAKTLPEDKFPLVFRILNSDLFSSLTEMKLYQCLPFPTYARNALNFSSHNYWRGPVWININWILYKGLRNYEHLDSEIKEFADMLKQRTIDIIANIGFFEYFDPLYGTGGHGTDDFSWTAALLIDLLEE